MTEEYKFRDLSNVEHSCEDCIHRYKDWDDMPCDACCGAHSGYQKEEGEQE